ncbi:protein FAM124A-like [Acanthaster planci]|uniref:Protein FAM124A-like n=1 Tax=Acanthaster planci TaxID=133434 RepID=A0A8B7Z1L3_ACAPL|nr:protein FAM124A-like [Acanthaster planci]
MSQPRSVSTIIHGVSTAELRLADGARRFSLLRTWTRPAMSASQMMGSPSTPPPPTLLAPPPGFAVNQSLAPSKPTKLQRRKAVSTKSKMALLNIKWVPIDPAPAYEMMSPGHSNGSTGSYPSGDYSSDVGLLKDPYALTLHFVTDPGGATKTKNLIKPLVKWFDPSFKLFNIAERSKPNGFRGNLIERDVFPALSVVLFLSHADDDGESENRIIEAQGYLARKPWRYHHHAHTPSRVYLCEPNNLNFYTTEQEMPLWGIRQVHYGKEHLRFMLYTGRDTWHDMIRFYCLLLGRDVEYQKNDFCYFIVHEASCNMDVQFALKIVPDDCSCKPLNSAFLQFKVLEIGDLVPLLPNSCSPISPQRWQTTDPDGNVTLLLVAKRSVNNNLPRVKPRRHSIDALQTLLAPKALKPRLDGARLRMGVTSPGLPAVDDDEEEEDMSC